MSWGRRARVGWFVACALAAACFSEPDETEPSGTTGDMCTEGALGCGCHGDGTCDSGLTCDADALRCVPTGCAPGQPSCACTPEGGCQAPYVCEAGLCQSPGASGTAGADDGSTSVASDDTTSAATTMGLDDTTTGMDATTTGDTGASMCDAMGCPECIDCADGHPLDCADTFAACDAAAGCIATANCLRDCGLTGTCLQQCCAGMSAPAITAALELSVCRADACSNACSEYELWTVCP